MPKLSFNTLVFDMDGTLLNGQNEITKPLREMLKRLKQSGYKLVVATGRTFGEVKELVEQREFDAYICSNAMSIYDANFNRIKHLSLQEEILRTVIEEAAKYEIYYELRQDLGEGKVFEKHLAYMKNLLATDNEKLVSNHEWHARIENYKKLSPMTEADFSQAVKVYFFHPNKERLLLWRSRLSELTKYAPISIESSSINSCEIVHEEASKGMGLQFLVEQGFTTRDQLICFGDSFNDLSMFHYASYSVAMKNAHEDVKSIAHEITTYSNEENGVLHWLVEQTKE